MLPVPPGKRIGNTSREGDPGVFERCQEDRLHPLVELVDDREQVLARLGEIGELLGQELVPLLERGEFLEGERIHAAELRELAFGVLQAPALLRAIERNGCRDLSALRKVLVAGDLLIRTVFRNKNILVEAELRRHPLEQARHVQALLVDLQLESVHTLGEAGESLADRRLASAQLGQFGGERGPRRLRGGELDACLDDGSVDRIEQCRQRLRRLRRRSPAACDG